MANTKTWKTIVPKNIDIVWDFFSRPENLNKITPDDMNFNFLTDTKGKKMYEGMIIRYKISPFAGIKFTWVTEITKISEKEYFIDEQRIGPYKMWHHEHHFRKIDEITTEMIDILNYDVGKSIFGPILDSLFIEKKVDGIFNFREEMISKYFK